MESVVAIFFDIEGLLTDKWEKGFHVMRCLVGSEWRADGIVYWEIPFLSVQLFHYLTLKICSKLESKHQRQSSRSSVQKGVYSMRRKHTSMGYPGSTEISPRYSPFLICGLGAKCPLGPSPLRHDYPGPVIYYSQFWMSS